MPRKLTILMVEEDDFFAQICARHFALHKGVTKVVKSFSEADKKLKRFFPDIIIIDVALEEKVGFKWIKDLRQQEAVKTVPIVVLTGLGDRDSIREALLSGANKYFLKSQITPHELAEQISKLI